MKKTTLLKTALFFSALCFSTAIFAQKNNNNNNNPPTTATNNNNENNTNNDNHNNSNHNNNNNPPVTASNKWEGEAATETIVTAVKVYPNPCRGAFEINFTPAEASEVTVRLTDALGKVVFEDAVNGTTGAYAQKVDLSTYNTGVYFLAVTVNGTVTSKRILYTN